MERQRTKGPSAGPRWRAIIFYLLGVVEALLTLRFFFKLAGGNPASNYKRTEAIGRPIRVTLNAERGGNLMVRFKSLVAWGLVAGVLAGLLFSASVLAQQGPPPERRVQECQAVLPSQTVDPILARYRERLQTARANAVNEERALRNLLVADTTTRAALDSQIAKSNDARNAFARVRLDALWELRLVIPAQDRERAFRCAERLMMRRR